jgi:hypothetical protein
VIAALRRAFFRCRTAASQMPVPMSASVPVPTRSSSALVVVPPAAPEWTGRNQYS